jgi:hypothetical protein
MKYTLVEHSAWTVKRDPCFERAVETATITTKRVEDAVRRAGGAIYYSWGAAHDAEQAANYPPEVEGLIPRVRGAFARYAMEGRRVYIPEPVTVKLEETHGQ